LGDGFRDLSFVVIVSGGAASLLCFGRYRQIGRIMCILSSSVSSISRLRIMLSCMISLIELFGERAVFLFIIPISIHGRFAQGRDPQNHQKQ